MLIIVQKSGKYVAKGPKKHLEVLQNESDKMGIKLDHMKLDLGVNQPTFEITFLATGKKHPE